MKYLIIFLSLLASLCHASDWETDYEAILKKSKELSKPVLIDFYADWCGPCKAMDKMTLPDEKVVTLLENYLLVKVDIDKYPKLAEKYKAQSIPQFTILNRHQERVDDSIGFSPADDFAEWLEINHETAFSDAKINELSKDDIALIEQLKIEPIKSIELICTKLKQANDDKRDLIFEFLVKVETQDLLPALEHPRLEVRLLASKLLDVQLQDAFVFDPWAGIAIRKKQFLALKEKLKK